MADSEIDLAIQNLWKAIDCLEAKVSELQTEMYELKCLEYEVKRRR